MEKRRCLLDSAWTGGEAGRSGRSKETVAPSKRLEDDERRSGAWSPGFVTEMAMPGMDGSSATEVREAVRSGVEVNSDSERPRGRFGMARPAGARRVCRRMSESLAMLLARRRRNGMV